MRSHIWLFLGYELDEELPWHSTVSRTRQLYPTSLFEPLFNRVFHLCVAQGLVAGDTRAIDSASVKANASFDSLCEKQAIAPPILTVAGQPAQTPVLPAAALLSAPGQRINSAARPPAKPNTVWSPGLWVENDPRAAKLLG